MSHVTIANYATPSALNNFDAVWKLTRALKKAGWIYKASANGTTKDTTGTAGNDKWGGNADPLADTIPALASGSWWCAQGPSTLKIPISAPVNGVFVKGENVSQAGTGATGEILGVAWDPVGSTGWAVIAPRVDGTGSDPHGWDHASAVTGSFSGANFTPSALVSEFVTEIVFWRSGDLLTGTWYFQCVEGLVEATSRFSARATTAGCTQTIAPGGGGTANTFPTLGSWVPCGTGGSASHTEWNNNVQGGSIGKVQIMAANATPEAGISADGSFICAMGNPVQSAGSHLGFGMQRVDDQEEGDVCPFVTIFPTSVVADVAVYNASGGAKGSNDIWVVGGIWSRTPGTPGATLFRSWRRRGMASGDAFVALEAACLAPPQCSMHCMAIATSDADKVASEASLSYVAEPIWVGSYVALRKTRKGTLRWLLLVPTGNGTDTWRNKMFVQLASLPVGQAMIGGPWDGFSTPVNG